MQVRRRTLKKRHNTGIEKPVRSQLLLYKEEGWQTATSTGLPTH